MKKQLNIQIVEVENGYLVMNNLDYPSNGQRPKTWIALDATGVNAIFREIERELHEQSDKKD